MKTVLEVLKLARAAIDTPEKWTKGVMARDSSHEACSLHSQDVSCYCTAGAVWKQTCSEQVRADVCFALERQIPESFPKFHNEMTRVIEYNDWASHAEVLGMFDRAIAGLEDDKCS